jgi:hypothetical protein
MQILSSVSQAIFCLQHVYLYNWKWSIFPLFPGTESYQFKRVTDKLLAPGLGRRDQYSHETRSIQLRSLSRYS